MIIKLEKLIARNRSNKTRSTSFKKLLNEKEVARGEIN